MINKAPTVKSLLLTKTPLLLAVSRQTHMESELLLAAALNKTRVWLLAHDDYQPTAAELKKIQRFFMVRGQGRPLAYILGQTEFCGLFFQLNKNVLIPRPASELLVETAWDLIKTLSDQTPAAVCDIGTGAGCLIISLIKKIGQRHNLKFFASDLSAAALTQAKRNARAHRLGQQIHWRRGDLIQPYWQSRPAIFKNCSALFILANLPYVPTGYLKKLNRPETIGLKFEPRLALDGGPDGLRLYRRLAVQLKQLRRLYPCLTINLLLECQPGQKSGLRQIFGQRLIIKKDLAGQDRLGLMIDYPAN